MALGFDELIERLLYDVALAGSLGLGAEELGKAVRAFYDSTNNKLNDSPHQEVRDDLLFADRPPAAATVVDDNLLDTVWIWLSTHPEVEIRALDLAADSNVSENEVQSGEVQPSFTHKHSGKRIFTDEQRVWNAIAGHGVDLKRIPALEFACLSVIASAGAPGILQPELTRITGQDKRSLPKRTDELARKGYITKESVLGAGTRTSLLRLKRYAENAVASDQYRGKQEPDGTVSEKPVIFYDKWFDDTVRLLKENENIIAFEDLRRGLDIHKKKWETKALFRCIRRLARVGCIDKLKARVDDGTGNSMRWARCIRLLREPSEFDRMTFKTSDYWNRSLLGMKAQGKDVDEDKDLSDDEDNDDFDDLEGLGARQPPIWTPDIPTTNQIFNLVDSMGKDGISSIDIHSRLACSLYRRPIDDELSRLTDLWQLSQPQHLRHLTLVKDTAVRGKGIHFIFRSVANFEMAVETGEALWDTVQNGPTGSKGKKKQVALPPAELDQWGFPRLKPSLFAGRDGRASLDECRKAVSLATIVGDGAEMVRLSPLDRVDVDGVAGSATPSFVPVPIDKRRKGPTKSKPISSSPKPAYVYTGASRQRRDPTLPIVYSKARATTENDEAEYAAWATLTAKRILKMERRNGSKRSADEAALDEPSDLPGEKKGELAAASPRTADNSKALQAPTPARNLTSDAKLSSPRRSLLITLPVAATQERLASTPRPVKKRKTDITAATGSQPLLGGTTTLKKRGRPTKAMLAEREQQQKQTGAVQQDTEAKAKAVTEKVLAARKAKQAHEAGLPTPPYAEGIPVPLGQPTPVNDAMQAADIAPRSASTEETAQTLTKESPAPQSTRATDPTPEQEGLATQSMSLKRKRGSSATAAPASPEPTNDRVAKIEAELLARSRPGAYINPPGARDLKAASFRQLGRPRVALIVVVKSERLCEKPWFRAEEARIAPKASRPRTSRVGQFDEELRLPVLKKRKRGRPSKADLELEAAERGLLQTENTPVSSTSMPATPSGGGFTAINVPSTTATQEASPAYATHAISPQAPLSRDERASVPAERRSGASPDTSVATVPEADESDERIITNTENADSADACGATYTTLAPDSASTIDNESTLPPSTNDATIAVLGSQAKATQPEISDENAVATESHETTVDDAMVDGPSVYNEVPHNPYEAEVEIFDTTPSRTNRKGGVGRSGGIVEHERKQIAMNIVRSCGGVYPGDRELWYPFATAWQKKTDMTPDRHTIDRVIKNLVSSGHLRRLTFSFRTKKGFNESRHVLTEPSIHPTSEVVRRMQKRIADKYPEQLLPGEVDIHPELRAKASNYPLKENQKQKVVSKAPSDPSHPSQPGSQNVPPRHYLDEFPEDATVFVRRSAAAIEQTKSEAKQSATKASYARTSYRLKGLSDKPTAGRRPRAKRAKSGVVVFKDQQVYLPSQKAHSDLQPRWTASLPPPQQAYVQPQPHSAPVRELHVLRSRSRPPLPVQPAGLALQTAAHIRSRQLMMTPVQTLFETTGTFSTAGMILSLQTYWQPVSAQPIINVSVPLPTLDVLTTSGVTSRKATLDPYVAQDKFDGDVDRIEAWEQQMLKAKQGLPSSSKYAFINLSVQAAGFEAAPVIVEPPKPLSASTGTARQRRRLRPKPPLRKPWEEIAAPAPTPTTQESDEEPTIEPSPVISKITGKLKRVYKSRRKQTPLAENVNVVNIVSDDLPRQHPIEAAISAPTTQKKAAKRRDKTRHAQFNDEQRLVSALAVTKLVCGGIDQRQNWGVINHALGFHYDGEFLRHRWGQLKKTLAGTVEDMQLKLQEPFLAAYERGELPHVAFNDFARTDWVAMREWAESQVLPNIERVKVSRASAKAEPVVPAVPSLPASEDVLESDYTIAENASRWQLTGNDYFVSTTDKRRGELAHEYIYGVSLVDQDGRLASTENSSMLLRSWARATVMTQQNYNAEQAANKIKGITTDAKLSKVIREMTAQKWFQQISRKGKQLPGRNYDVSNEVFKSFNRWPGKAEEWKHLRLVAEARTRIVDHFEINDKLDLPFAVGDPEMVVLTNMLGQGHLRITTELPERNDDFDAPFPKLTAFGYAGNTYQTKSTERSLFRFPVFYEKTSRFTAMHGLKTGVPIPQEAALVLGEPGLRLPFWTDIHGRLLDHIWDMVLRSLLHILHFRPGATVKHMEQAHAGKLWAWEIELMIGWMVETGMVERCVAGREIDGTWKGGWKVTEWWYCAFLPEIATWRVPRS